MAVEAEGEKKGAMGVENGEERSTASDKGKDAAASEKGKGVAEAKEVARQNRLILKSSPEGKRYEVSEAEAQLSGFLVGLFDTCCNTEDRGITLQSTARTLDMVVEYLTKHAGAEATKSLSDSDPVAAAAANTHYNPGTEVGSGDGGINTAAPENLEDWDRKLVDSLSMDDLLKLLNAADFLSIKGLTDLIFQKAADMIKGKTTEEIRATFNIVNDFTPEEEENCRLEFARAFNFVNDDHDQ